MGVSYKKVQTYPFGAGSALKIGGVEIPDTGKSFKFCADPFFTMGAADFDLDMFGLLKRHGLYCNRAAIV
jgi:hypothetical protein